MNMENTSLNSRPNYELYTWAKAFVNTFRNYLSSLTPRQKESASLRLYKISFNESQELARLCSVFCDDFESNKDSAAKINILKKYKSLSLDHLVS